MLKSACVVGTLAFAMLASPQYANAELKSLGDNVYKHFSNFYSSLVVVGDDGVLVVDPAWTARAEGMSAEIAAVTDKKVTHVVLTHEHYDHVGGSEVFAGAEIVCHSTCQKIFDLDVLGIAPKKVTKSFKDEMTIDLGGKIVKLHHLGTGDGIATTIVSVPADKIAATADLYGPKSLTNGMWLDDKNYLGTRKILNEIAGWNLKHALSGHSDFTDPAALRENAAFLNDLYDAVKAALDTAMASGGPRAAFDALGSDLPKTLKLPKYADWKGYDQRLPKHIWRMGMSIMRGG
jgi:glyoxylase-like metal-dependent hydrolase (beta-lactamase superfamily II)